MEPEITNGVLEEYQIEVLDPSVGGRQSIIAKRTGLEVRMCLYAVSLLLMYVQHLIVETPKTGLSRLMVCPDII